MGPTGAEATIHRVLRRLHAGEAHDTGIRRDDADRLMRRWEPIARRTCRACTPGASDDRVDDLVQETLLTAWRRLPDFEHRGGPDDAERWVKQIARYVCANARRARVELLAEDGLVDPTDPAATAFALLRQQERDAVLSDAIDALGDLDQDVLYHRYVHGLDRPAIAEVLGLADAEAVRVALQRAQRRLKAELARRLADLGHGSSLLRNSDG